MQLYPQAGYHNSITVVSVQIPTQRVAVWLGDRVAGAKPKLEGSSFIVGYKFGVFLEREGPV